MLTPAISSSQCRAARGLLGLSQEDFADLAGVHVRTVVAVELAENRPTQQTILRITTALRNLGVVLLPDGDGLGAGVRLAEPEGRALIVRRDALGGGTEIGMVLRIAGRPSTARISIAVLARDGDVDAALASFDAQRLGISNAVARKFAAGAIDADGHLRVTGDDLVTSEATA